MTPARRLPWPVWAAAAGLFALLAAGCGHGGTAGKQRRTAVLGPVGQLSIDDGGRGGVAVLFVHSFAGSTAHWQAQLAHLRPGRRAIAMDLRGHGLSDPPRSDDYAINALADDIEAVADALGLQRFVLVGHSMGGAAAAAYAGRRPERLAGLVLVGTPGRSPPEQAQQIMASLDADYDRVMANYGDTLLKDARQPVRVQLEADMRRVQRQAGKAMTGAIFQNDPAPALAAYRGPALIVDTPHGEGPGALYRQLPRLPRELVTGTSHWPQLDEPDRFNRLLDGFLAQLG